MKRNTFVFLFVFLFLSLSGCKSHKETVASSYPVSGDIDVKEAYNLIKENKNKKEFVLIDVRTEQEYLSGHINGAINIDFYGSDFRDSLLKLDKNSYYIVYCRSGNRSSQTASIMRDMGFGHVYNMLGGILEWQANGFELSK